MHLCVHTLHLIILRVVLKYSPLKYTYCTTQAHWFSSEGGSCSTPRIIFNSIFQSDDVAGNEFVVYKKEKCTMVK